MNQKKPRKRMSFQEREKLLLKIVRRLLREGGYRHLTIERIAEASSLTRNTVYTHFRNSDDAIMALCVQSTGEPSTEARLSGSVIAAPLKAKI